MDPAFRSLKVAPCDSHTSSIKRRSFSLQICKSSSVKPFRPKTCVKNIAFVLGVIACFNFWMSKLKFERLNYR